MKISVSEKSVTVFLSGEIDHHNAGILREGADRCIIKERPRELILDFSEVTFMDSSGVGFVMGRYKTASAFGCKTAVTGLKDRDRRILLLSGMQNKIEFR